MNFVDGIIINTIHILLPILLYVFYVAYNKVDDERENNLTIFILVFSILYISIKYNIALIEGLPSLLINVALLIAYIKRKNIAILITSLIIVWYLYSFYNGVLFLLVVEYLTIYLVYLFMEAKFSIKYFVIIFSLIKFVFMVIAAYIIQTFSLGEVLLIFLSSLWLAIYMFMLIYFMQAMEGILKMHKSLKETVSANDFRNSLFKITHEIKNPIAVCKGYLDMFDVNNRKHAIKYIPIIKGEIDKTLLLLDDFLSMNKLKLNKDVLDINLLVNEVFANYSLYLKEKKIKFINNILDDEIYINGDYNRLMQVLVNIIKNSVEAMEGKGKIEATTKKIGNKVSINIKDSGKGMSKEILSKIKEPFFTTKENGNGLGVALSYEIVEAHGGKMQYNSEEGKYTSVEIVFPILEI